MKILADENIPHVHDFFDLFGEVRTAPGRNLSRQDLLDVDVLLVRSVTKVNRELLQGSKVKFVGTCTIGTDHLDKDYLQENQISFASAPGCNAGGVVQYDLAALTYLDRNWRSRRVGVIGNGNVGHRVCETLSALGVDFCAYDPLLSKQSFPYLVELDEVLNCDVVCVHAPYTTTNPFPSHHLISSRELNNLKAGAILLNAGRGGVIDNSALLEHLKTQPDLKVVLDVWEGEPSINLQLMDLVDIATPHIAGYSYEGKIIGNQMIFFALTEFLQLDPGPKRDQCGKLMSHLLGENQVIRVDNVSQAIEETYSIADDDRRTRQALKNSDHTAIAAAFDRLRKLYPERREFGHYRVQSHNENLLKTLVQMGFESDA